MYRVESVGHGPLGEPRPALVNREELEVHDWLAADEAVDTGTLVRLELEQLKPSHGIAGRGDHLEFAAGCGEHDSSRIDVEYLDASIAQYGEHVDYVEVIHEVVGHFDQCPNQQSFSGHRSTDRVGLDSSATRAQVGAESRLIIGRGDDVVGRSRTVKSETPIYDISTDIVNGSLGQEGVGTKSDQRLGHASVQLDGHHAGCLVDNEVEIGILLELDRNRSWWCIGLEGKDGPGGHDGHGERVGELRVVERSGSIADQRYRAEAHCADPKREREHGSGTGTDGQRSECRPPSKRWRSEVGGDDGLPTCMGIERRTFAQGELQVVKVGGDTVGRAEGASGEFVGQEHDARTARPRNLGGYLAEDQRAEAFVLAGRKLLQDDGHPVVRQHHR
jgi:hypothetical protein